MPRRVLVVDGANVVGSRPDGWWRDRAGAAGRLRDRLAAAGLPFDDVILVVEGAARGVEEVPGVRVVRAVGSGDDALVEHVAAAAGSGGEVVVVTADRGLKERVAALGGSVQGPSWLLDRL